MLFAAVVWPLTCRRTGRFGSPLRGVQDDKQKLPVVQLYDLRHTAATLALAAGVPVKVVSEMLGALTLDVYSHLLPHVQDEAAALVEALLQGPGVPHVEAVAATGSRDSAIKV